MNKIDREVVAAAANIAGLSDFTGYYTELGGGELNDTYLVHCEARDVILRVSRHPERNALRREERALRLLESTTGLPAVIFFSEDATIDGHTWIIEEYQPGQHVERLSIGQFQSLGALLAKIHSTQGDGVCLSPWDTLVSNCHRFGDEAYLMAHPDERLQKCMLALKERSIEISVPDRIQALRHCDVTPSNTLVDDERVALIDWELSGFGDPMTDFSTGYWSDMELNNGRWRQQLSDEESQALYRGYVDNGGVLDEELARFYELVDKASVAAYLYWRLRVSDWQTRNGMDRQYEVDYENVILSLERALIKPFL